MGVRRPFAFAIGLGVTLAACLAGPSDVSAPASEDRPSAEVVYLADSFGRVIFRGTDGVRAMDGVRWAAEWAGETDGALLVAGVTALRDALSIDRVALATGVVTGHLDVPLAAGEVMPDAPAIASVDGGRSAHVLRVALQAGRWTTRIDRFQLSEADRTRDVGPRSSWKGSEDERPSARFVALASDRLLLIRGFAREAGPRTRQSARWTLFDPGLRELRTFSSEDRDREWLAGCRDPVPLGRSRVAMACALDTDHWTVAVLDTLTMAMARLVDLPPRIVPAAMHAAGDGRIHLVNSARGPRLGLIDTRERTFTWRDLRVGAARLPFGATVAAAKEPVGTIVATFGTGGRFAYLREPGARSVTVIDTRDATYRDVQLGGARLLVGGSADGRRIYALEPADGSLASGSVPACMAACHQARQATPATPKILVLDVRNGSTLEAHPLPSGRGVYSLVAIARIR